MNELLSKKKLNGMETIALTESCSAILTNKLPPKMKDPGSFTIPCSIHNRYLGKTLCDLRANVNLMPLSTFRKLGICHMKPIAVTLQLAGRFLAQPEGKIKDILVCVDKFIFQADFIILDYEANREPSIEKAPTIELKPLPNHLKYIFLGDNNTFLVIVSATLDVTYEEKFVHILKQHKRAIARSIVDIQGFSPSFYMYKIKLEDKVQCVPKKSGFIVVSNDKYELISTHISMGWRVCMDYRKLNVATRNDHFPLSFINQMLDRIAKRAYYYFVDDYSGYNQSTIALEDQEKKTFTYPFCTFVFRHMRFGLCSTPAIFQRCMMAIFSGMIDFSIYGNDFDHCANNLDKVLQ
ncbi:uncharacterized protein LOC108468268 [Gossypium arboreum]|uniref:uncharacterized protein LOC108468268 n=1 Tax=Gossypium arboreum TaxID=29729 RepID=UPI0008197260|nr:uncharacterized protein LOC108468268 [Gossypium arboreum]